MSKGLWNWQLLDLLKRSNIKTEHLEHDIVKNKFVRLVHAETIIMFIT